MREMHSVYFNMSTARLRKLYSQKYLRVLRLREKRGMSYADQQELRKLTAQMAWINAVLESRDLQLGYLE